MAKTLKLAVSSAHFVCETGFVDTEAGELTVNDALLEVVLPHEFVIKTE